MAHERRGDPEPGAGCSALNERSKVSLLLAAARRFCVILLATIAGTTVVSLVVGLLLGSNANRAVSLGFYGLGCFLLIAGFFIGNRGPARPKGEGSHLLGPRFMRWATPEEREDTLNTSAVFVALGLVLLVLGIVIDNRVSLY